MTILQPTWELMPVGEGWDIEPDAIVWVSVAKIDSSFAAGDQWVGPAGSGCGQQSRYESIGRHFLSGYPMYMPYISLDDADQVRFTDGRHRFAWVRDHGATALPVATGSDQADRLQKLFGSEEEICRVEAP
jgi:hypothetical protein